MIFLGNRSAVTKVAYMSSASTQYSLLRCVAFDCFKNVACANQDSINQNKFIYRHKSRACEWEAHCGGGYALCSS